MENNKSMDISKCFISFNMFRENDTPEQIKENWERTGLLEGLNDARKYKCAALFNDALYLIENEIPKTTKTHLIHPIIRRVVSEISVSTHLTANKIIEETMNMMPILKILMRFDQYSQKNKNGFDAEAEFATVVGEIIVNKYRNNLI